MKGVGSHGPNASQNITLKNGCQVPIGQIVDYKLNENRKKGQQMVTLHNNEFIVYEESQVRIRYLVQLDSTHE